jgi:hypothetical protein
MFRYIYECRLNNPAGPIVTTFQSDNYEDPNFIVEGAQLLVGALKFSVLRSESVIYRRTSPTICLATRIVVVTLIP